MKNILWFYIQMRILFCSCVVILKSSSGEINIGKINKRNAWSGEIFKNYPDVVDVDTLCEMLGGISRKLAYKLLGSGEIESVRIGRSYKIPKICVCNYLFAKV